MEAPTERRSKNDPRDEDDPAPTFDDEVNFEALTGFDDGTTARPREGIPAALDWSEVG